ncbi:TetR/AcrR family transcriptional regulator [Pseudonocardia sp. WMMC193]|uniref:TetR/AcrR family transcriptional regulator n=1 Tax=Pseudonocardia sp. WMMC193 TaxID=2911965 RepID=UPI001F1F2616|nr:TetR/AcrR family transcriptional regulator [Pseudonocardia sp. WMMC193]MCF7551333.1 TetR/AcrR family transcriptional regulator [Pseudonocardia sp. WMMC193]
MTSVARDAQKARTHRALIDAALALTSRHGPEGLTVDTVAERAGVSRRTVFNHFATLDEILLAACTEVLDVLVDGFLAAAAAAPPGAPTIKAVVDDVVGAMRVTDLVGPMAYLTRALGGHHDDPRVRGFVETAFGRCTRHLSAAATERYPTVDRLDVELAVGALLSGVLVLHGHWWERTGATDDAAARAEWDRLLDHLVSTLRKAF